MSENEVVAEEASPKKVKPLVLIGVLAVSVLVGAGVGVFVAVPLLAGSEPEPVAVGEAADSARVEPARSSRTRDRAPILFSVDNMVLNPRGTGGTRFLMVTAAFEVRDAGVLDQMRAREHEVRDALLGAFGQKSVEELADLEQREGLRESLRTVVEALFQPGSIERVYLPQFVIQ